MRRMTKSMKTTVFSMILGIMAFWPVALSAAHIGPTNFAYVIGMAPLCDLAPDACPVITTASNGDILEVTGSGTISIHPPRSATGGGTFVHKDPDGNVIGSGTWEAVKLLGFVSYGSGEVQGLPPEFFGGRAFMKIRAFPDGFPPGVSFDAIVSIDCTLGDRIPPHAVEGVETYVVGGPRFTDEVSGFTVFVAL